MPIPWYHLFNMSMVISSNNSTEIWSMFFVLYSVSLILLNYLVMKLNLNYINQMIINNFNLPIKICCWLTLLSMGGFPPLMGFFGKMMVIKFLIMTNELMVSTMLILMSLLVMFFYTRMVILSIILFFNIPKWMIMTKFNFNSFIIMTSLILPLTLFNLKSL